ncbi:MAG TPA: 3-phosphoshikimate 1-carboxyvinyltransferase [Gammaproteobacteria bacterium]|nr:3-phosphoshikimate 1-carboxyvinyltransferase [Gammaproteobacteria bacterium]HCG71369.1 3-phosphoshikimate 1-carboxyvinyltransferase [Gammaproteobacteria bacterium]
MIPDRSFTIPKLASGFEADITLPGSKSIALRQLAISALVNGVSRITGVPKCDDTDAMIECLQVLGVGVEQHNDMTIVSGPMNFGTSPVTLNPRMSGASTRLLIALAALRTGSTRIDGHASLRVRTNAPLFDVLRQHGCAVDSDAGTLPATIHGSLNVQGALHIDGSLSSQYITALMIIAPVLAIRHNKPAQTLHIKGDLVSRPYLDITLNEMRKRSVQGMWNDQTTLEIPAAEYPSGDSSVEGDASAASYFSALATLHAGTITLTNLDSGSVQGDYGFCDVMEGLGAKISRAGSTCIQGPEQLEPLAQINMQTMPDVALTLIAMSPLLSAPIEITGLQSLHHKECDRLECPATELRAMGVGLQTTQSTITVVPLGNKLPTNHCLTTYHDHRMAMAFATLGSAYGTLSVDDKQVVNKTYPEFWRDYARLAQ